MNLEGQIVSYVLFPILLFSAIILFWFIQSLLLLYFTRKYFLPVFYKHKITEIFIVEFSIAIHELSHLIAALFTGSEINLKESFISSRAGRIATRASHSIGGWISIIIAAFAPAFVPSMFLFAISIIFFGAEIDLHKIINGSVDIGLESYLNLLLHLSGQIIQFLLSIVTSPTFPVLLFVYISIISSLTSAPSEDDWRASRTVLLSLSVIPLLIVFILLNFVAIQFKFNLFLFVSAILTINTIFICFGILANLFVVVLIYLLDTFWNAAALKIRKILKIHH
ncbi:MAG: hypothetical protein NZ903_00515 [Candidatus Micrarchaeota archaeon]|nr:hypothetical protein [Candidatus Micrarchaeota archaeon]